MSKKTTGVIVGADAGSKAEKARQLGVPMLDEAAFLALIGRRRRRRRPGLRSSLIMFSMTRRFLAVIVCLTATVAFSSASSWPAR